MPPNLWRKMAALLPCACCRMTSRILAIRLATYCANELVDVGVAVVQKPCDGETNKKIDIRSLCRFPDGDSDSLDSWLLWILSYCRSIKIRASSCRGCPREYLTEEMINRKCIKKYHNNSRILTFPVHAHIFF